MKDCVTIFSGGGICDIGLRQGGFRPLVSVDFEPNCLRTIKQNHPSHPCKLADLEVEPLKDVLLPYIPLDFAGLIWLSPPCQGFSTSGLKGGEFDPRNQLIFRIADACRDFPDAWVIGENVKGLLSTRGDLVREPLFRRIKATRRAFKVWKLNALDFGLSQHRERVFIVCPPMGKRAPEQPIGPTKGRHVPLRDAIGYPGYVDVDKQHYPLTPLEVWLIEGIPPGGTYKDDVLGRAQKYAQLRVDRWKAEGKVGKDGRPLGMGSNNNLCRRLSWDKPGYCVMASSAVTFSRCDYAHPMVNRKLTIGECRTLMGIPASYRIRGNVQERKRIVGNGVAVPVARAIGEVISRAMDGAMTSCVSSELAERAAA